MPISRALQLCPDAVCVRPRMARYAEVSRQVFSVFHEFTPLVQGLAPHVDLWLAETQSSIVEARAIHAGLPKDGKPFWLSFTLKDEDTDDVPRLRSGEPVAQAAEAAAQLGVQVLLFNCSQPEVIGDAVDVAQSVISRLGQDIAIGAYANAFPPQPKEAKANDGLDELRADGTLEKLSKKYFNADVTK